MKLKNLLFSATIFLIAIGFVNAQPVKNNGQLSVKGTFLVNEKGEQVVLRGVSYGWHNWWPRFYNETSVKWLADDWKCTVVRAAMGVGPSGSYIDKKEWSKEKIEAVVNGAIENGIYVIIDWHSHEIHTDEAVAFFAEMAEKYGKYPNVIYEIFNEPVNDSWETVKAYSIEVIKAIRAKDPDNIILVGSPHWDQDIHLVADAPITGFTNLMYTVHFYAATHGKQLRDRSDYALKKGIPIFVSECAGMKADGNGAIDYQSWNTWIDWMEVNKISWITWSIADKNETCSMLKPSASDTGNWKDVDLKESGIKTREKLRELNSDKRLTGSLKDKNGNIMRGTPMVLGKHLGGSVAFATDIKNWETIKNNGYNTIRVCWVDPWYKDHGKTYWKVSEVLPSLDKCVENATATGMNIIINFHGVGSQQDFDKEFTFAFEKEFWEAVAPRYKDNDLVYYEIANEPSFEMDDYLKPAFKQNLMEIYHSIRTVAPERHIMMFSFNTIINKIVDVVEGYKSEIDWDKTSIAYHMYNYKLSEFVVNLMAYNRVICTEWNYDHVAKEGGFGYIKRVDGFKENSQTLEAIGSSWVDWRDWDDTTLNELLDTTRLDAITKNYWWGEPVAGVKATAMHISHNKIEIKQGQSKKITAYVLPALAENQKINWSSSDNEIASVDENGLVTANSTESKLATITATSVDGNFTKTCEVKVIIPEKKGAYPDGGAHIVPGTINPTYYDMGGEGIGYHDLNATNAGNGIRPEQGVDTEYRLPEGTIGGIQTGEWLEYTIDVEKEGIYIIEILFATPGNFGKFHIEFDAQDKTGTVYVKSSQSYSTFKPAIIENIALKQGTQVMRIYFDFADYNMGTISISAVNPTAITENDINNSVKIYPNPAGDKLFISSQKPVENYTIQNLSGQTILQGAMLEKQYVDLKSLIKGAYLVCLMGNGFSKTSKFVKL